MFKITLFLRFISSTSMWLVNWFFEYMIVAVSTMGGLLLARSFMEELLKYNLMGKFFGVRLAQSSHIIISELNTAAYFVRSTFFGFIVTCTCMLCCLGNFCSLKNSGLNPAKCALGLTDPDDFIFSKKSRLWCSIKSKLSVVD